MRERSPHAAHSTVSQTGFTAEPAASSNDDFSCSTFSAAAAASDGLTVAGSALATVLTVGRPSLSTSGSVATRKTGSSVEWRFGVLPRRSVSASTVSSSLE